MSKYIILDGDTLTFSSQFGDRTVTPINPGAIKGTGQADIGNKKICIVGDEKKVSVEANYFTTNYPILGQGKITIASLADDQLAVFCTAATPVIIAGSQFVAVFTPTVGASNPQGSDMDLTPKNGSGKFINSQTFVTTA